jgi:hypothetical protein
VTTSVDSSLDSSRVITQASHWSGSLMVGAANTTSPPFSDRCISAPMISVSRSAGTTTSTPARPGSPWPNAANVANASLMRDSPPVRGGRLGMT